MGSDNIVVSSLMLAFLFAAAPAGRVVADDAQGAIRSALKKWTDDFNAGRADAVCALFSRDLRYDFRGYPERDYEELCSRLHKSLSDSSRRYAYDLDIREVIVSGDMAAVRLVWTLTVTLPNGQTVTSVEPGLDIFRRDDDGQWKIIRYLAYEAPEPPSRRE
jgi:steroid delta-isomerase